MPWVVIKAIKCQLTVFLRGLLQTPIPHRDLGGGGLGDGVGVGESYISTHTPTLTLECKVVEP